MVRYAKEYLIVPISALRALRKEATGKDKGSGNKRGVIGEIPDNFEDKLKGLVLYYKAIKEKAMFFSKPKNKMKFDSLSLVISQLGQRTSLDDWIYEPKGYYFDKDKLEILLKLRIHSEKKVITAENSSTLEKQSYDFRRGRNIIIIFHIEDNIIEFKTPIIQIYEHGQVFISNKVISDDVYPIKKFTPKKGNTEVCKLATIFELNFAGADTIIIKGSDVTLALKTFASKGIDLEKLGILKVQKTETEDMFKISESGQVNCKESMEDAYNKLKEVYSFG